MRHIHALQKISSHFALNFFSKASFSDCQSFFARGLHLKFQSSKYFFSILPFLTKSKTCLHWILYPKNIGWSPLIHWASYPETLNLSWIKLSIQESANSNLQPHFSNFSKNQVVHYLLLQKLFLLISENIEKPESVSHPDRNYWNQKSINDNH